MLKPRTAAPIIPAPPRPTHPPTHPPAHPHHPPMSVPSAEATVEVVTASSGMLTSLVADE